MLIWSVKVSLTDNRDPILHASLKKKITSTLAVEVCGLVLLVIDSHRKKFDEIMRQSDSLRVILGNSYSLTIFCFPLFRDVGIVR